MAALIVRKAFGEPWTCFFCNIHEHSALSASPAPRQGSSADALVSFTPVDAFRRRAYLEPLGVLVISEGAEVAAVVLDLEGRTVNVSLEVSALSTSARLKWEHWAPEKRPEGASLHEVLPHHADRNVVLSRPGHAGSHIARSNATAASPSSSRHEQCSSQTLSEQPGWPHTACSISAQAPDAGSQQNSRTVHVLLAW